MWGKKLNGVQSPGSGGGVNANSSSGSNSAGGGGGGGLSSNNSSGNNNNNTGILSGSVPSLPISVGGGAGGGGGEEGAGGGGDEVRRELSVICYESNILGAKGPRKMTALVPPVSRHDNKALIWRPMKENESILEKYKRIAADHQQQGNTDQLPSTSEYLLLTNKTPKWNDQLGAYVLNFNGRVTAASVKNFQLIQAEDQDTVLLQFGRVGKDSFTMDIQWPLSPLQAFAICLSSFDYKLACE